MKKAIIFETSSQYRDSFRIRGYEFGDGENALAVIGSMRGNEHQQMFVCAQLIQRLTSLEAEGRLIPGKKILVIPCANPYSMNIRKRFWSIDNTDINRMFPGYDQGETTQRIAAGIFEAVKDYAMGVQLASFYMRGSFAPHIRIMHTGFEDVDMAKKFGLSYVIIRRPRPFDTTTLNYNWQIWNTQAFSLYTTNTEFVNRRGAALAVESILHFMEETELLKPAGTERSENVGQYANTKPEHSEGIDPSAAEKAENPEDLYRFAASAVRITQPRVITDKDLVTLRANEAGFFETKVQPGGHVTKGEEMALITDAYDSHILGRIATPCAGTVLFMHSEDLCYAKSAVFKIIRDEI